MIWYEDWVEFNMNFFSSWTQINSSLQTTSIRSLAQLNWLHYILLFIYLIQKQNYESN